MTTLSISSFGGEIPRLSARDLPAGSAQISQNLLATSNDFNPVKGDAVLSGVTATSGAKTLYRRQSGSNNAPVSGDANGWETFSKPMCIVRGMTLDDSTERTYYSTLDGSEPPFAKNNNGETYTLGIPRPPKPVVSVLRSTRFTNEQAIEWRDSTLKPAITNAILSNLVEDQFTSRFVTSGTPDALGYYEGETRAGITVIPAQAARSIYFPADGVDHKSQRGFFEPCDLMFAVPLAGQVDEGLKNPQLGGVVVGDHIFLSILSLPIWGQLNEAGLSAALAELKTPNTKVALLSSAVITSSVESVADYFNPDSVSSVPSKRTLLDSLIVSYLKALENLVATNIKPVKLVGEKQVDFDARLNKWLSGQLSSVSAMVSARLKASEIVKFIEGEYFALKTAAESMVDGLVNRTTLEKTSDEPDGLLVIDSADVEMRFYVTTYVTGWGEESSPSEPSQNIELMDNDLVVVQEPSLAGVSTGRNIVAYRIYRSNSGSTATEFQFVKELTLGSKPADKAPVTVDGNTGTELEGFGDKDKWRDIVATWLVYTGRGQASGSLDAYLDTSMLVVGDVATQHNADNSYSITKTWNGSAWVMQQVSSMDSVMSTNCYVDSKYGASLGEVIPTTTWLPPPYRTNDSASQVPMPVGENPYLRGFTGMANGIIVGFIDNFIAPCEPYSHYAFPVEYQIPLEFPIVGLCAFGQSMLVGTRANPYVVSGSDSASLSARKLNNPQACVSAQSMVAADGGVFYASQDGYCFADESRCEVVTQGLFSNEGWQALRPETIIAALHDSVLYFWYTPANGIRGCYGLDLTAKKLISHKTNASAVFEDVVTDFVYAVDGTSIKRLFSGYRNRGVWKSGKVVLPKHSSFAWIKVVSDFAEGPVTVKWYADGELRHTAVFRSTDPCRMPPGYYLEHEIEVQSSSRVSQVQITSSTAELRNG